MLLLLYLPVFAINNKCIIGSSYNKYNSLHIMDVLNKNLDYTCCTIPENT